VAKAILPPWQRAFFVLATIVLTVAAIYWAAKILIVLALALLFSFVLQPVVAALQRGGLKRGLAVILTVCLALGLLSGLGWVFTSELQSLSSRWETHDGQPGYKDAIQAKINALDPWGDGTLWAKIQDAQEDAVKSIVGVVLMPAVDVLISLIFILVLVIFVLLRREDLRNRLIRLVGQDQRTVVTTKAMDEAAQRISRYLLMQVTINAGFGLLLGIGLYLAGLQYAMLWGFLAAIMRFIPYIGIWVATALPLLFSAATSATWTQPLIVVGLFFVLEMVTANVLEPLLFGMSAGVSPLALVVALLFWGWLWGPIGMVLSTPLTVVLLVMGRYIPQLEFMAVLLGEEPALETSVSFYQRLLARDLDEATDVIEDQLKERSLEQVSDEVLIPALVLARRDREHGELAAEDEAYILQATRDLINNLGNLESQVAKAAPGGGPAPAVPVPILGCPATDAFDEVALEMFRQVLESSGAQVLTTSEKMLSSEVIAQIETDKPALVVVTTLPPGGVTRARYLCKRLRSRFPELKLFVGRWGLKESLDQVRERLQSAGADQVVGTLAETRALVVPLVQALAHVKEPAPETPAAQALPAATS
jgi:predicted PurR-regulated permease PerM